MSTADNLRDLNDVWVEYIRAYLSMRRPKLYFIGGGVRRWLIRAELCPVWRRFEKHLQQHLDPVLKTYADKWRPNTKGYRFYYDHYIRSEKSVIAGNIKTCFYNNGSVRSTYVTVRMSAKTLYSFLFSQTLSPGLIGAFIARDMIHELRHQYQYSNWPETGALKLHRTVAESEYYARHTEIDAFAVGAAFGYLTYGSGCYGKDKKKIKSFIHNCLRSQEGQEKLMDIVPELEAFSRIKQEYPKEWQRFIRKSYKNFNTLLSIHFDE